MRIISSITISICSYVRIRIISTIYSRVDTKRSVIVPLFVTTAHAVYFLSQNFRVFYILLSCQRGFNVLLNNIIKIDFNKKPTIKFSFIFYNAFIETCYRVVSNICSCINPIYPGSLVIKLTSSPNSTIYFNYVV
jgi:hypothetical protein